MNTSTQAFVSIAQVRGDLKRRVFRALMDVPNRGATCDELERILELKHQTLSARVRELWQEGFLKKDGIRPTRSGRMATIYKIRKYRVERKGTRRCPHCGQVMVKQ